MLFSTIGGRSSRSATSGKMGMQSCPRPWVIMKLTISGVTFSAAQMKSPSFSRSSASIDDDDLAGGDGLDGRFNRRKPVRHPYRSLELHVDPLCRWVRRRLLPSSTRWRLDLIIVAGSPCVSRHNEAPGGTATHARGTGPCFRAAIQGHWPSFSRRMDESPIFEV